MRAVFGVLVLASGTTSIARVVELLGEYRGKVQTDGEVELELYNKFACWCEDTMHTKTRTIAEAKVQITDLTEEITKLQASTASSTAEMARLSKAVAENGASSTSSQEQRSTQKSDFQQQESDLETCLGNLKRAITVLAPQKSTSDGFRDRADEDLVAVAQSVRGTLDLYERAVGPAAVKKTGQARQWVKSISEVQLGSPHLGTYAPQSTAIQGILQQLDVDLTGDLKELRETEAANQQAAEELRQSKRQEKSQLDQSLEMTTSLNANDGVTLASSTLTRTETEAQLAADEEMLSSTTENCATRASEWSTRSRIRTEELAGINEAIETLNGTAAQGTFSKQENKNETNATDFTFTEPVLNITNFLQLSAAVHGPKTRKQLSIITMASKVTSGHFDEVMHYIDQYVASLKAEGADDESHKAWCVHERNNADNKVSAMDHDLEVLEAEHGRADDKQDELKADLSETETVKDTLATTLETAQETRVAEQAAQRQAMADTVECVRLVESAMGSLSKVYGNNDVGASFLQIRPRRFDLASGTAKKAAKHGGRRALLHQQRHEHEQKHEQGPEPGLWASGGGSAARESDQQGVMAVLSNLKSTLEADLKEQKEVDAYADAQFDKFRQEAAASDEQLGEKIGSLERAIAAKDRDIVDLQKQKGGVGEAWNATSDYLVQLKPNCDWVELTYDTRKTDRASEIAGLQNAKVILSGFTEEGLVATRSRVQVAAKVPVETESVADELAELHDDADAPPPPPL